MRQKDLVKTFWTLFDQRDFESAGVLLSESFLCHWPCTQEKFDKQSFIKVNVDYPGKWFTKLKQCYETETGVTSIVHVYSNETIDSYYATSFFKFSGDQIVSLEEYWSAIESPPEWRKL